MIDLPGGIEMNLENYNNCFKEIFGEDVVLDDNFKFGVAQGWDSMAHMELLHCLQVNKFHNHLYIQENINSLDTFP